MKAAPDEPTTVEGPRERAGVRERGLDRIAELEAEVDRWRGLLDALLRRLDADAEHAKLSSEAAAAHRALIAWAASERER